MTRAVLLTGMAFGPGPAEDRRYCVDRANRSSLPSSVIKADAPRCIFPIPRGSYLGCRVVGGLRRARP